MAIYTIRPLTLADIPAGMALKQQAGWNQTVLDWELLLRASQGGSYAAVVNGKPVGTITTVSYAPHFSWIGMLLVHSEYRRQGIGTNLLRSAIGYAENTGAVRLDARPAGKPIYLNLGFVEECELYRMVRMAEAPLGYAVPPPHRIDPSALQHAIAYDKAIFGADRQVILSSLYDTAPQYGFYTTRSIPPGQTKVTGFCLGRSGSQYHQIGPIVADNINISRNLLISALSACGQNNIIIDVPIGNIKWLSEIQKLGFIKMNEYTRMILGPYKLFGQPDRQYAIAGPEIG